MDNKVVVGGQAVIEGVMMRGPKAIATAVRKKDGTIVYRKKVLDEKKNMRSTVSTGRATAKYITLHKNNGTAFVIRM